MNKKILLKHIWAIYFWLFGMAILAFGAYTNRLFPTVIGASCIVICWVETRYLLLMNEIKVLKNE